MGKIKEYKNGELTIVWKPEFCIYGKEYIEELPFSYNPIERLWFSPGIATTPELTYQVSKCPFGALNYLLNNEKNKSETEHQKGDKLKIDIMMIGPLIVQNKIEI